MTGSSTCWTHENTRHVAVVDEAALVGIVSMSDVERTVQILEASGR